MSVAVCQVAVVVLTGRGLVAQAELQASAASFQSSVIQRLLQLRGVLLQHRKGFRLLDREMRSHLTASIDVDSNVDLAKVGRI